MLLSTKPTGVPDVVPVLSRGRHRNPRRGACIMEFASLLAGERWSDHPGCTHPLLAQLARLVNDHTSDTARQELAPLVPSLVGRLGDDHTWFRLPVTVAAATILDAPESTQHVLAAGLLRAEQLCAGTELSGTAQEARVALDLVPGAVAWVDGLQVRGRIDVASFRRHSAPTMVRCAAEGIVRGGGADRDERLRAMLELGIASCPPARGVVRRERGVAPST